MGRGPGASCHRQRFIVTRNIYESESSHFTFTFSFTFRPRGHTSFTCHRHAPMSRHSPQSQRCSCGIQSRLGCFDLTMPSYAGGFVSERVKKEPTKSGPLRSYSHLLELVRNVFKSGLESSILCFLYLSVESFVILHEVISRSVCGRIKLAVGFQTR